jgi:ribosomal protein L12E/L44/L45/RPP1/RPP2
VSLKGILFTSKESQMKKLIAILMVASFAGVALPASAQTPTTPAPAASTPAAPASSKKTEHKKQNKKHKKENKGKTEPKT